MHPASWFFASNRPEALIRRGMGIRSGASEKLRRQRQSLFLPIFDCSRTLCRRVDDPTTSARSQRQQLSLEDKHDRSSPPQHSALGAAKL